MANSTQRSFAAGELAPALYARADLAKYAIGLRTCRNMVVMRAGGATKRPGTQYVGILGQSAYYTLTLTPAVTAVAGRTAPIVAVLADWLGNVIGAFPVTFTSANTGIATVASTGPLTATVTAVATGSTTIAATIPALGLTAIPCAVTVTDYYILHAFVGDGTWNVTTGGTVNEMLIIGGGGSGASVDGTGVGGGGGGAGELIDVTAVAVTAASYPIVIGGGGVAPHADHSYGGGVFGSLPGNGGTDTTCMTYRARGGGGGGLAGGGGSGGSGGGSGSWGGNSAPLPGGASTAVSPGVGHAGGTGIQNGNSIGAGGGGAGSAGSISGPGTGVSNSITGTATTYAAGGGCVTLQHGAAGAPNTGNGGQGGGPGLGCDGGNGGKGVVFIKYRASTGIVATGGIMSVLPYP